MKTKCITPCSAQGKAAGLCDCYNNECQIMEYYSDANVNHMNQIAIVEPDGRRAICFIPSAHPDSDKIREIILAAFNPKDKPVTWYDATEMRRYLKSKNYSDEVADELCADYAHNFNLAYEKGMTRQSSDVRDISVVDPETGVQNNVRITVQQYIKKCNYSLMYEDILYYYNEYYLKGEKVSHTVEDTIKNSLLPAFGAYFNANKSS